MYKFSVLQTMTLTAMLLALYIIATRLLGIYITPYVRFSFGVAILIYSSILLGPISGAIIGGVGDILGIVIVNTSGISINPLITLTYFLMGATPGLLMMLFKKINQKEKIGLIIYNGLLLLIWSLITGFVFTQDSITLFNSKVVMPLNTLSRSLVIVITFLLIVGISIFTYFLNAHFFKKYRYNDRIVNVYYVAFIVMVVEIVFTLFINSLMKVIFYNVAFEIILLPALFLAFIYIPLNTIIISYLFVLTSKVINLRG